jgi:hypothetical protein
MDCPLPTCFLLGLLLVPCRRTPGQTVEQTSSQQMLYPTTIQRSYCDLAVRDCVAQVMVIEEQNESIFRSKPRSAKITIQQFKKEGKKGYLSGATNCYQVVVEYGRKTKIRKIFAAENWRRIWWRFNLGGFLEMASLDPYHFDKLNYDLKFQGEEVLLGRSSWVYHVSSRPKSKKLAL